MANAIRDFLHARAIRTNPAYAQQAQIRDQRQFDQQEANRMAQYASQLYDPLVNADPQMSPEQKWAMFQKRVLESNIPGMQAQQASLAQALQGSSMSNYQSGLNNLATLAKAPDAVRQYEYARGQGYQGTFEQWKEQMKASTNINLGKPEDPISVNDLGKLMLPDGAPVPVGTTPTQAKAMGAVLRDNLSVETGGRLSMLNTALNQLPNVSANIMDEGGKIDQGVIKEMFALNFPFVGGFSAPFVSDKAKAAHAALETGMQAITRTETGAAMPESEIDNTRKRFMPSPFESPKTQEQKLLAYIYFLKNATDLLDPQNRANVGKTHQQIWQDAVDTAFKKEGVKVYPQAPPVGTVDEGFTYIGGDPSRADSWKKTGE